MPIKSWAFRYEGHVIRAEIYWGFFGWNRKRVYVDHARKLSLRGRFTAMLPLKLELENENGTKREIAIRFKSRRLRSDMECEVAPDGVTFSGVETAFIDKARRPSSADDEPETGVSWRDRVGCLVVFPLLIVLAVLYAPMVFIGRSIWTWRDRKLRKQLCAANRRLTWHQIEQRMSALSTPCTLILQAANLTPIRVWWTEDDITRKFPLSRPHVIEVMHPSPAEHPFIEWVQYRYLALTTGKAFITELPPTLFEEFDFCDFQCGTDLLHTKYPLLNVIHTGYAHSKPKTLALMAGLIGDNLDETLPKLLQGTANEEPVVRRFCLRSLTLAGERAASLVSQLQERLYLGHKAERYLVVDVLSHLGSDGMEVLKRAQKVGDPRIAKSVVGALCRADEQMKQPAAAAPRMRQKSVRPHVRPRQSGIAQDRRLRRESIIMTAMTAGVVCAIAATGWYWGTLWTLAIFAISSMLAVGIFIWWHHRAIRRRIGSHRRLNSKAE